VGVPPGSTTVEIDLDPTGDGGTRLRLVHRGLDGPIGARTRADGGTTSIGCVGRPSGDDPGSDPFASVRVPTPRRARGAAVTAGGNRFTELAEPLLATAGVTRSTMMGLPCLRREGSFFAAWDRGVAGQAGADAGRRAARRRGRRAVRTGRAAVPAVGRRVVAARAERARVASRSAGVRGRVGDRRSATLGRHGRCGLRRRRASAGSGTCSTSSVPTRQPSSSHGRPATSPRTSSSASTTASPDPDSSCPARGVGWSNDDAGHSR
jgi:hypothetical protein